ncbi:MAG: thioredoxin [Bacilli bacterium]|nr:thioredoxin [Bacilli bacterium]
MIKLTDEKFGDFITKGTWLVDFYADWCGPCKMLAPILEELDGDIDILKVNVDHHPDLAQEFKIMSIPTIIYFKDGNMVKRVTGFQSKEAFINDLAELK